MSERLAWQLVDEDHTPIQPISREGYADLEQLFGKEAADEAVRAYGWDRKRGRS